MPLKSFSFNGVKKDWVLLLAGRQKAPFAPIQRNLLYIPGRPGAILQSSQTKPMIISQPIGFKVESDADALQLKDELASWLVTDEPVALEFDDEPNRTYYAVVQNTLDDFERMVELRKGTIQFLVLDGYGYGPELEATFPSDVVTLTNNGTAEADPVFELEVLQPVTFAMIQNQNEEYMMIGKPVDVDTEVVDTRTLLLEERGATLDTWSSSPTSIDGGTVDGYLSTDNDGITVPSFGEDVPGWHGPALVKEVTPTQDFEVEMMLEGRTPNGNQTFRIEFYLFDENMNVLGKMAIIDDSPVVIRKKAEGRIGPYVGRGVNYLISYENYQYNWEFFYGMLRMKRVGNRFDFYVTRINNDSKHVYSLLRSYTDVDNEFAGRLKYVQIHIGKYGDTERAYGPKINSIKVYSLTQETQDQTPYIAYAGDTIVFDHIQNDILINGEPRMDLKDFGAKFFKLQKGENQLVVMPNTSFNVKAIYRERFL